MDTFCSNKLYFSGEEFQLRNDLKVRAFKTYHVIPSQARTSSISYLLFEKFISMKISLLSKICRVTVSILSKKSLRQNFVVFLVMRLRACDYQVLRYVLLDSNKSYI